MISLDDPLWDIGDAGWIISGLISDRNKKVRVVGQDSDPADQGGRIGILPTEWPLVITEK
jgi:hypothetical protein